MAWKIIKYSLIGMAAGIFIAGVLYAVCFVLELGNCACQLLTCKYGGGNMMPGVWKGYSFLNVAVVSVLVCLVIGAACGIVEGLEERRNKKDARRMQIELAAKSHRQQNAKEMKNKISNCCDNLLTTKKYIYGYSLPFEYEVRSQSETFCRALAEAYKDNAVIKCIVEESEYEQW